MECLEGLILELSVLLQLVVAESACQTLRDHALDLELQVFFKVVVGCQELSEVILGCQSVRLQLSRQNFCLCSELGSIQLCLLGQYASF